MHVDLSDQSIDALAEIIAGGSAYGRPSIGVYRQGWHLRAWFEQFGVDFDVNGQSRMLATKKALRHAVSISGRNGTLLRRIIEAAADPRDFITEPERHVTVVEYLNRFLLYDGLKLETAGRSMRLVEIIESAPVISELSAMTAGIDFDTASRDLERALRAAANDPELAVTSACAVVESVCRSILVELQHEMPSKQDISGLYRAVRGAAGFRSNERRVGLRGGKRREVGAVWPFYGGPEHRRIEDPRRRRSWEGAWLHAHRFTDSEIGDPFGFSYVTISHRDLATKVSRTKVAAARKMTLQSVAD